MRSKRLTDWLTTKLFSVSAAIVFCAYSQSQCLAADEVTLQQAFKTDFLVGAALGDEPSDGR